MIEVKDLYKEYRVAEKGKGLSGTVKALFKSEKKIITASQRTTNPVVLNLSKEKSFFKKPPPQKVCFRNSPKIITPLPLNIHNHTL